MAREWLVWLGVGCSASLQSFDYSAWNAQLILFLFFLLWVGNNMRLAELVNSALGAVLGVFFREVESSGWDKVTQERPTLTLTLTLLPNTLTRCRRDSP